MADIKNVSKVKGVAALGAIAAAGAVFGYEIDDAQLDAAKNAWGQVVIGVGVLVAFGQSLYAGVMKALSKDE